jgi:hypothetical protein
MLDMIFCLFPFALNKQICSQQEEPSLRKDEISIGKTDNHLRQLIPMLNYFNKIIEKHYDSQCSVHDNRSGA